MYSIASSLIVVNKQEVFLSGGWAKKCLPKFEKIRTLSHCVPKKETHSDFDIFH